MQRWKQQNRGSKMHKNSEIAQATKGAMLAGNVFQLLENVSMVAQNERKVGQLVVQGVLAENVKVIGK
jgi:predicted Zn-dependent protease